MTCVVAADLYRTHEVDGAHFSQRVRKKNTTPTYSSNVPACVARCCRVSIARWRAQARRIPTLSTSTTCRRRRGGPPRKADAPPATRPVDREWGRQGGAEEKAAEAAGETRGQSMRLPVGATVQGESLCAFSVCLFLYSYPRYFEVLCLVSHHEQYVFRRSR